jgi:hypothetical protein
MSLHVQRARQAGSMQHAEHTGKGIPLHANDSSGNMPNNLATVSQRIHLPGSALCHNTYCCSSQQTPPSTARCTNMHSGACRIAVGGTSHIPAGGSLLTTAF